MVWRGMVRDVHFIGKEVTTMENKDQLPAGGCGNCGAYDGESQSILRKRFVRSSDSWLCRKCAKKVEAE